jgi:hypothetical protein
MLLSLVFGAIFLTVLGALSSFSMTQYRVQNASTGHVRAVGLAEAGLEYYRWFLAHNPGNLTNGTGLPGPYTLTYNDPEGGVAGTVSLSIVGNTSCGEVTSVDINSTGSPADGTGVSRTLATRYAQPTVAKYSYVINDSVWAGSDRIINGPYHSNGGIRMDGTVNAPVTSSLSSWLCTSSFGCSPSATQNGVFGAGTNSNLWSYPSPQVDFAAISADFTSLKTKAQANGVYLPRYSSGNSNGAAYWKGYHLIFNSNGTVTVNRVTAATSLNVIPVNSADASTDRALIGNETSYNTYTIPVTCGLIFVEDTVWIEGTISGKVTLVAANVVDVGVSPNAILKNNISYASVGSGLTVFAEKNVLVAPDSPQTMSVNGIFIAQGGAFGRNLYRNTSGSSCNSTYEPRTTLTIYGTTVSNKRTGTKWTNGCGSGNNAGYQTRIDSFDRNLATDPPPFTPIVSSDYEFVDWRQK